MKGVINYMDNLEINENDIIIRFTNCEFEYLSKLCNTMYKKLKKFPKNMRTQKFYILENMVNNYFNE